MSCPSTNTAAVDESSFLSHGSLHFDAHRIGWIVAGATTIATCVITLVNMLRHLRAYTVPSEQRQIVRILLLPAVYGIISFCSYRWYRSYYYYSFIEVAYEALVIAAFMALLLLYIGRSPAEQRQVLKSKDKVKIPFPLCCFRYRPGKPYGLHLLQFSVLQYCFVRPLLSIISIITYARGVYCPGEYSVHYAAVYIESIDFVSISVALYGLIAFYALTREQLKGHSPLAKFLTIKYQGFIFNLLATHNVLKPTAYWTSQNIANGLQALATCCEMVLFAVAMLFTFSSESYRQGGAAKTSIWRSLFHALNFADFAISLWAALRFFWDFMRRKPGTRARDEKTRSQFAMTDIEHAANGDASDPMIERKAPGHGIATGSAYQHEQPASTAPMDYGRPSPPAMEYARPPANGQV